MSEKSITPITARGCSLLWFLRKKNKMSRMAHKMSHVAQKSEPCGSKKRAVWHLSFW